MNRMDTKMTVSIPKKLMESFMQQLDELALKRDAFLVAMLDGQLPYLEKELAGLKLSGKGRRHIAGSLKRMGTKKVNVVISKRLAREVDRLVRKHGLVRDAVISRLIALLRSEKVLLEALDL